MYDNQGNEINKQVLCLKVFKERSHGFIKCSELKPTKVIIVEKESEK